MSVKVGATACGTCRSMYQKANRKLPGSGDAALAARRTRILGKQKARASTGSSDSESEYEDMEDEEEYQEQSAEEDAFDVDMDL